jgi:hypothetical protein
MATAKEAFELAMGALRAADFDLAPKVNDGALENPPQHLNVSMVGFKPGEIGQYPFIDMLDSQFSQPIDQGMPKGHRSIPHPWHRLGRRICRRRAAEPRAFLLDVKHGIRNRQTKGRTVPTCPIFQ